MATKANSDLKNSNNMSPTSTTQQQKVPQRKKKAARACVHCQKVSDFFILWWFWNSWFQFIYRHIWPAM